MHACVSADTRWWKRMKSMPENMIHRKYLESLYMSVRVITHLLLVKCVTWLSVTNPLRSSSLSRHSRQLHEHFESIMSNRGVYWSSRSRASTTSCENSSFSCDSPPISLPAITNPGQTITGFFRSWILPFTNDKVKNNKSLHGLSPYYKYFHDGSTIWR